MIQLTEEANQPKRRIVFGSKEAELIRQSDLRREQREDGLKDPLFDWDDDDEEGVDDLVGYRCRVCEFDFKKPWTHYSARVSEEGGITEAEFTIVHTHCPDCWQTYEC